jgi:hypothetical protein
VRDGVVDELGMLDQHPDPDDATGNQDLSLRQLHVVPRRSSCARDRAEAVTRMRRALAETVVEGIKTTIPFHLKLLADPTFLAGDFAIPRFEQHS